MKEEKQPFITQHKQIKKQLAALAETLKSYVSHIQSINQKNALLTNAIKECDDALKNEKESFREAQKKLLAAQTENETLKKAQEKDRETIQRMQSERAAIHREHENLESAQGHEQALLQQKQQEIAALREANAIMHQANERTLAQLASLEEQQASLQKPNEQFLAQAPHETIVKPEKADDELSALRRENAELKATETKKFLRMKEISDNFKLHIEKSEQERYDLQQKIADVQQKSGEAAAQKKNADKNQFLALERNKELERLLHNKSDEYDQLQKKMWIIQKENEAFRSRELEDAGALKTRLKEVVGGLKDFSDRLEKEKKELVAKNERLDKQLTEKEKELYEKEAEQEVLREQIVALQDRNKLLEKESLQAGTKALASPEGTQDLSYQTEQFLGFKSENKKLTALLEEAKKEKETLLELNKQLKSELATLNEMLEKQKTELEASSGREEGADQGSEISKDERVMLAWYRSAFEEHNKEKKAASLENRGLKEEIENLREELKKFKGHIS